MLEKALEKLDKEFNAEKDSMRKHFATEILKHLKERCKEDEGLCADILQEHKTWKRCFEFINHKAQQVLKSRSGFIDDPTVFEWAEDYFRKDDKAEIEKEKKAEQKKKADKAKAKKSQKPSDKAAKPEAIPNTSEPEETVKTKTEDSQPAPKKTKKAKAKPKAKKNETEGQMSMFDFLGG